MHPAILVGTTSGLYEAGHTHPRQFAEHKVEALACNGTVWWAIVDQRELWCSDTADVGRFIVSLAPTPWKATCLLPTATGLLLGTSEAHLFALRGDTLEPIRSFDTAPGRETWYTPWGGPPDVRSMSTDLSGSLYVNVHVGGVVRSADDGQSWTPTIDVHADVHQVLVEPSSGLVLAASARGLAISDDRGASWRFETSGLHGRYLRAVAVAGETIVITASTGPYTRRAAVYWKPLRGEAPFERCRCGLPDWFPENINTACLAAFESWVAFGTSDGMLFLSADEGQHWRVLAEGLPPVRCVTFVPREAR